MMNASKKWTLKVSLDREIPKPLATDIPRKQVMKKLIAALALLTTLIVPCTSFAWNFSGEKIIYLHDQLGKKIPAAKIMFTPNADAITYTIDWNHALMKDYFLSMREFKCFEGETEVQCLVPYPYKNPQTIEKNNYIWLEHSLLFLFKAPKNFGAKLWNGIYYKLSLSEQGLTGEPQAIDLNLIAAPPENLNIAPYGPEERGAMTQGARWFTHLTIE